MGRNVSIGGETSHIGVETSHIFRGETSSVSAKRLTGGRNVLNWGKSSRRRGAKRLEDGCMRNVLGGETSMVRNVLEPVWYRPYHIKSSQYDTLSPYLCWASFVYGGPTLHYHLCSVSFLLWAQHSRGNTGRSSNAGLMLGQRCRRWASTNLALADGLLLSVSHSTECQARVWYEVMMKFRADLNPLSIISQKWKFPYVTFIICRTHGRILMWRKYVTWIISLCWRFRNVLICFVPIECCVQLLWLVVILCRNVPASITSCTLALGVRVGGNSNGRPTDRVGCQS